jgi:LemA protein
MEIIITISIIIIVLLVTVAVSYNSFVKLRNQIEEAFSTMDIYLKKRYDMIPNLKKGAPSMTMWIGILREIP